MKMVKFLASSKNLDKEELMFKWVLLCIISLIDDWK